MIFTINSFTLLKTCFCLFFIFIIWFFVATAANKFKSQFYLVFEFCEHDLAGLLSNQTVKFSLGEQKKIMQQLLNGALEEKNRL